ncbi:MAG TPA: hypothetical protein VJ438_03895 [Candidatus Nanoarchaeia archaeon]|nr:hypothetical protein [Candidatus Nanoarchaeia archaeon]
MKKLIFIVTLMLLCINFNCQFILGVNSYTINTVYNFSDISFSDQTVYKTDSVVLRIKTPLETACVYGISSDPSTAFEGEYGYTHEAYLNDLEEGFHEYYVRCGDSSNPVITINFATSIPIYATIKLSEEPPLKEGKYEINLITSKISLGTPTLEYSFDEIVYKPISLKGSDKNWEGNLIISDSIGEAVCSFRFKAKDLSGEEGTKISGDNSFIIDTIKPSAISIINAVGYEGEIKLDWFFDEKATEFNIYKSENPQVDYTKFYKTTSKDYFYDNDVEKGKTYYYRVAGVDEADNIGDLSKEVYATALLSNYSKDSGLNPSLIGKVDNFITEINSVMESINEINYLIELKEEKEKNIFTELKLDKELDNSISQLNSLKRDVESYKLQDLSEEELNKKISSATLNLNIIKKKVPEDITITNEKQIERILDENAVQRIFLEYSPNSEYDYKKEIADTLKIIEDKKIKINSEFYNLEIMYIDGTKKDITLVKDIINPKLEKINNLYFILSVPKEIAEKSSELKIMNLEYSVVKDDPIISFNSNTPEIIYYVNKEVGLDSFDDTLISPLKLLDNETKGSRITGNSILNFGSKGSWGIIALAIFAFILGVYFLKIKNESSIKPVLKIMEDLKKVKEFIKEGKEEEANRIYSLIKEKYKLLSEKEKEFVVEGIENMKETISK